MRLFLTALLALALLPATAAAQDPEPSPPARPTPSGRRPRRSTARSIRTARRGPGPSSTARRRPTGSRRPTQSTAVGDEPVAVQAAVQSLTASRRTTTGSSRTASPGADRTFKTAAPPPNPAPPAISRLRRPSMTATSARLSALIDPNRAETTWHVDWGTSTNVRQPHARPDAAGGRRRRAGVGRAGRPAAPPAIYWRVVASNAAGSQAQRPRRASSTLRAPSSVTLSVFPAAADLERHRLDQRPGARRRRRRHRRRARAVLVPVRRRLP